MAIIKVTSGNVYNDFQVGQVFRHHWGRTIVESDNILFTTLTMTHNPLYFNREYAKRFGHRDMVVNPLYVFHTILGLSVEDLSESGGGPFLGVDGLEFNRPVYPGDTLYAESTVIEKRESKSRPEFGIVTWRTLGKNQKEEVVIGYIRRNLVLKARREP
ncbi:MAG: MaoC family dehydratase [Pseudomonadota bacterium]